MKFHVLTLFPQMILDGLSTSILGKAIEKGHIAVNAVNIRDFTLDKHGKADDYPYGGGAGLLMQAQPVFDAHKAVLATVAKPDKVRTIYLTPQGKPFNQKMAEELAKEEELIFLCGHYEGIDERVLEKTVTDEVSLGDFVLTGGELPAMVMIDAISRLVPEVLHNDTSALEESFSGYLLEYPQYSKPEEFLGKRVPKELLSGDHKKIREWRQKMAEERTKNRRPDLYAKYEALMECSKALGKDKLLHIDMTELILRGQAVLIYHGKQGTLLQDKKSETYLLTAKSKEDAVFILEASKDKFKEKEVTQFVCHQDFMEEVLNKQFGLVKVPSCVQMVYTKKEALPQVKKKTALTIQRLTLEELPFVLKHYDLGDETYIKARILAGVVYGAFVEGKLVGFIGEHIEGSMGMLFVLPDFRRMGIAESLETELINNAIKKGYTPYCQIFSDNASSMKLQEKLGLYPAKEKIWWFNK